MALSLRLRRAIALSSSLLRPLPTPSPSPSPSPLSSRIIQSPNSLIQTLGFRSSSQLFNDRSDYYNGGSGGEGSKISPDEILFEGCDYNHWLITMDFPKDPKPTPEEMVETYVQTLAKVVGSVEEAKKRMYACSTTTYTGFQAVMTEEMSKKFEGMPGVVFILPDSYLYPETKEYGGDKYDNGVITPRPPPVHYGRQNRQRNQNQFQNENRFQNQNQNRFDRNQPAYNAPPPPQQQQGNFQNYLQGPRQGYGPQQQGNFQNYPQGPRHGYGPQQQGNFQNYPLGPRQGYGSQQGYNPQAGQDGRGYGPPPGYQGGFNQGQRGNFTPQEQRNFPQEQGNHGGHGQSNYGGPIDGQQGH